MCPNLFFLTDQLVPSPALPLERIGFCYTTRDRLIIVACQFAAYHAVMRSTLRFSLPRLDLDSTANPPTPPTTMEPHLLLEIFDLFAEVFYTEAHDARLVCQRIRSCTLIDRCLAPHASASFLCSPSSSAAQNDP